MRGADNGIITNNNYLYYYANSGGFYSYAVRAWAAYCDYFKFFGNYFIIFANSANRGLVYSVW